MAFNFRRRKGLGRGTSANLDARSDPPDVARDAERGVGIWTPGTVKGTTMPILLGFAVATALGLARLATPLFGDQALFAVGARQLNDGQSLYGDLWDIKQPGIYWFYQVAERAFGSSEVGIHLMELAWQLATGIVALAVIAPRLRHPRIGALVPVFVVGLYYATANANDLTQIEALVGLPLACCLWAASTAYKPRYVQLRLLACGAAAGVALVFKFILVPVICVLFVFALVQRWRDEPRFRTVLKALGLLLLGTAMPIALLLLRTWRDGQLSLAVETWFELPRQILSIPGVRTQDRFISGFLHNGERWAPLGLLALLLIYGAIRQRDPLKLALLAWTLVGALVVANQLWWEYNWLILTVPLGLLGVLGMDQLLTYWQESERRTLLLLFTCLLLLAFIPPLGLAASQLGDAARWGFGITSSGREGLQSERYGAFADALKLLGQPPPPGSMYVLGDPTILYLARKPQPVSINGWSPDLFVPANCRDLRAQLADKRPDYLYIDDDSLRLVRDRCPREPDLQPSGYSPWARGPEGTWYRARR